MSEPRNDPARPRRAPQRPRRGRPVGAPPRIRPVQVWLVSGLLVLFGTAGVYLSWLILDDAIDHGEPDSVVVLSAINLAVAAVQIGGGVLVFIGTEWGRRLAIGVCLINAVGALILAVRGAGAQAVPGVLVNGALCVALLSETVSSWCNPRR